MEDWRALAACRDADVDLFFAAGTGPAAEAVRDEAKRVCGRCRVREACLDFAVGLRISDGVYGGLDEFERRALLKAGRSEAS